MLNFVTMKKILLPIDFSETSDNAFVYAIEIAKIFKAELVLLHTFELPIVESQSLPLNYAMIYETIELTNFEYFKEKMPQLHTIAEERNLNHLLMSHILMDGDLVYNIKKVIKQENIDLSQAEAVADLISSDSEASHQIAMQQMRGGFSNEISKLREELLNFASLIELELDFAEEDVEFADRTQFTELLTRIEFVLKRLIDSFSIGNVIKNGIPVAIVGEPNVGKSTLLNALLNEERAIVSEIAGTTRDTIEDELVIGGISFRFIDTAGIRETIDVVESIGIKKTFEKIEQAQVVLYLVDGRQLTVVGKLQNLIIEINKTKNQFPQKPIIIVINKKDLISEDVVSITNKKLTTVNGEPTTIFISAKNKTGIDELKNTLLSFVNTGALRNNETIITNTRHYDSLLKALKEIQKIKFGLNASLPSDLMAIDIRQTLYYFGEITGEVTNDELLGNIFANFCIGK